MTSVTGERVSPARDRLLRTASALFYGEGIRAVGVDRVVHEAGVTRATFYRHFPSKDDLIVAYLGGVDRAVRTIAGDEPGPDRLRRVIGSMTETACGPGFRGCAFINAAAEFADPAGPVHRAVVEHRRWLAAAVQADLAAAGHPDPARGAAHLVMLRDGAMVAGQLGDPARARDTLLRGLHDLLAETA
ncbi:MAG TPA: TetR/AcrR family transcriptional regulator [Pseudonocardia sp.]|jgi:AcrR family transcriptional regulator|nr:TetR/AcrR family transcriptional regulator [Pseudonocardia sp.]